MADAKRKTTKRSGTGAIKTKPKRLRKKQSTVKSDRQTARGLSRSGAATSAASTDPAAENLQKIDKIVVLMMETAPSIILLNSPGGIAANDDHPPADIRRTSLSISSAA